MPAALLPNRRRRPHTLIYVQRDDRCLAGAFRLDWERSGIQAFVGDVREANRVQEALAESYIEVRSPADSHLVWLSM